jgi:hypothetical protein
LRRSRRSWAISCKASAYFVNSLVTHVRAALSSQALIALWVSRETDSTVGLGEAGPPGIAEPVVSPPDRPSKDWAETDEIGPKKAPDRAMAIKTRGGKSPKRFKIRLLLQRGQHWKLRPIE